MKSTHKCYHNTLATNLTTRFVRPLASGVHVEVFVHATQLLFLVSVAMLLPRFPTEVAVA